MEMNWDGCKRKEICHEMQKINDCIGIWSIDNEHFAEIMPSWDRVFKKAQRYGYLPRNFPDVSCLVDALETNLFNSIGSNSTWLDLTRLDTFDFVEQVETSVSSETSRAFPTWRTTNNLVQV